MKKVESYDEVIEEQLVCPVCRKSFTGENLCPDDAEYLVPASELKIDSEPAGEFDVTEEGF